MLRGALAASLLALNTLFWCAILFLFALVKLIVPARPVRAAVDRILNGIATRWVAGNSGWMSLTQRTQWDVAGLADLPYRGWYMVNCNHQSWVDILVLQHLLNRRIPMLKFFLKQQLIYVPVIGLAWWALDFPFMRRHSDAELKRHPEKRFDDIEATRRACEKFALVPTSVMNFAEGTRFTQAKHRAQHSPYRHLLKPKAGALALALNALGGKFDALLDVTIVYPDGVPTFWQFLCGNMRRVVVRARTLPIPPELRGGDYSRDPKYRKAFQHWLQDVWHEKDATISGLLGAEPTRMPTGPLPRSLRVAAVAGLLTVAACGPANPPSDVGMASGEWREFQGTWTATGSRHRIALGPDRRASIADYNGSLLLTGTSRPAVGFRAEAIVLNDSATGMVGRAVWTDDLGYEVYSEIRGDGSATGNRVVGTFLGGTGPYAGATGNYEFSWKFMIENESGAVQGQSVGFKGRARVGSLPAATGAGGTPQ